MSSISKYSYSDQGDITIKSISNKSKISYSDLGLITDTKFKYDEGNKLEKITIICENGNLVCSYTVECCSIVFFRYLDKDAFTEVLLSKTISNIHVSNESENVYDEMDTIDRSDVDKDIEYDAYRNVIKDTIYTITFTDTTTYNLTLRCLSNGAYSSYLITNLKKKMNNKV